ncbi:MAG TPA: T9SS type A sorting domain-containing protein [Bacteroidales bacterium]|nr:T9SS type A sorting domain-containing protein [Bacteroidales bacterium]MDI9573493.1 T9SS type A sorting domain-containing protein [Bacteroidota bacterium]OQC59939.1 MAG: hypothetical protein BWX51_01259 [Bacteroidetes bacterium ADurb.Bin012]MBP9512080.1 T9SS type A sorting domain-containing protein [Bacteroidales bacterium]MBP9588861.1 T9SS type A sorting domain-containing protein [Bacteroidales bacterium]
MKTSARFLLPLLIILISSIGVDVFGQTITISLMDGTSNTYPLTSISKIYFEGNNLIFNEANMPIALDQIRKITFTASSGINIVNSGNTSLVISPNPASDAIKLFNLPNETCTVYIFDLTGLLVLSCILNPSNTSINVNNLTKGIYLVKVMNSTAKFIKL